MGLGNILLLAQVTIYLITFILSFFIFVPVNVNLNDFDGHCLLFATGKWSANAKNSSVELSKVDWGSVSSCNFVIFVGIVLMMVSGFYVIWYSILLFKTIDSTWLDAFITTGLNFLLTIFTLAAALIVSLGFRDWCTLITAPKGNIHSCENGEYIPFNTKLGINARHFYAEYEMAQFGIWTVWICQLLLLILSIIKLLRYHSQEAFLTSMHRERQRLIQRVQSQSYSTSVST